MEIPKYIREFILQKSFKQNSKITLSEEQLKANQDIVNAMNIKLIRKFNENVLDLRFKYESAEIAVVTIRTDVDLEQHKPYFFALDHLSVGAKDFWKKNGKGASEDKLISLSYYDLTNKIIERAKKEYNLIKHKYGH